VLTTIGAISEHFDRLLDVGVTYYGSRITNSYQRVVELCRGLIKAGSGWR
jgi:hypothetical protein